MKLKKYSEKPFIDVPKDHQMIGEILNKHEIGFIKCSVETCLHKDVVSVHFFGR